MKKPILLLNGVALFNFALIIAVVNLVEKSKNQSSQDFLPYSVYAKKTQFSPTTLISGKPVLLKIPKLKISLSVKEGRYDPNKQVWEIDNQSVFHAVMTPWPNNQAGNTLIYGHNQNNIFEKLNQMRQSDLIQIETDNHKAFTYNLISVNDVQPNNLDLFAYEGEPIVTLQTCAGAWNKDRRLFTFALKDIRDLP